jgi:hypothetical protein
MIDMNSWVEWFKQVGWIAGLNDLNKWVEWFKQVGWITWMI